MPYWPLKTQLLRNASQRLRIAVSGPNLPLHLGPFLDRLNLACPGIHYAVYDSESSVDFFKLLVPIGKGVLLLPHSMMNLPPRSVSVPVAPVPHPATVCFFYKVNDSSENVRAFASDFQLFKKKLVSREHGAPL